MAFKFGEKPNSRNGGLVPAYQERLYFASGSADENFVLNSALAATPAAIFTPAGKLYRQDIRLDWQGAAYCIVIVPYTPKNIDYHVSFDTTGGTVHVTSSLATASKWGAGGLNDAPDMKQTIGVNGDDVDGCDIVVPALKITVSFKHPQGIITMQRVRQLSDYTASVNTDVFLGFEAGEVLFLGSSGGWGPETETTVQHQFACVANRTAARGNLLNIGDVLNIVKAGHDYAWVRYVSDVDAGRPVKVAKHVYVEQVYSRAAFIPLLGFG